MLPREELDQLNTRITAILVAVVIAFGILGFGFWKHQIVESLYYRERARNNEVREIRLPATRGRILDREGRVIADSRPAWRLIMSRDNRQRPLEETFGILAAGIEESEEDLLAEFLKQQDDIRYLPIVLSEDLSPEEVDFVEARRYELPDVSIEFRPRRQYAYGALGAHALGYVGEISDQQLSNADFEGRRVGDIVGITGLERQYDRWLQGREGSRIVIVDKDNQQKDLVDERRSEAGADLVTTLDLDLQIAAEEALGDQSGVAVAIRPQTGEVLVLASKPSFDPTLFADGIGQDDLDALNLDPRKPFRNRAIQDHYSPGSVFKVFMTAVGLGEHVLSPNETLFCGGSIILRNSRFACWNADGHGHISLHDALVHSCNVFFYQVGDQLDIDVIAAYANQMGLGRKTGIDLPNENAGIIPSREWKERTTGERWYPGETISVSIGQGAVSVTPFQLTWAMGGLAIGGELVRPRLVNPEDVGRDPIERESYSLEKRTLDVIRAALWDVVNGGGTGTSAQVQDFDVAGKTGTAQVVARTLYGTREEFEDHAWFVGFAPYDNPEIAVGVFVENGGHGGSAAGPIAQAIFQTWFDKTRGRITQQEAAGLAAVFE